MELIVFNLNIFKVNYELAHGSTCEKVQFLRKLSKGPGPNKEYGIKLAKLTALPAEITADAEKLSKELRKKCGYTASETSTEDTNEQNVFGLAEHLLYSVHSAAMPEKELLEYLRNLQQECMGGNTSGGNDESRDVTSNSEECMRGNTTSGENDESRDVTSNSEECMGGNTSGGNDESRDVTSNSEECMRGNTTSGENDESRDVTSNSEECMGGNTSGGNDESRDVTSNSEDVSFEGGPLSEETGVVAPGKLGMGDGTNRGLFTGSTDPVRAAASSRRNLSIFGAADKESFLEVGVNQKTDPVRAAASSRRNLSIFGAADKESFLEVGVNQKTDPVRAAASSRRNLSIFGAADKESFLEVGVNQKTDPVRAAASSRRNLSIFGAADKESFLEVGVNQKTDPVRAAASSRRNLSIFGAADKESFLEVGVNQKTDPVRAATSSRRNLSIFGAADEESFLEVGVNQKTDPVRAAASSRRNLSIFGAADKESFLEVGANQRTTGNDASFLALGRTRVVSRDNIPPFSVEYSTSRDSNKSSDGVTRSLGGELMKSQYDVIYSKSDLSGGERAGSSSEDARTSEGHFGVKFTTSDTGYDMQCSGTSSDRRSVFEIVNSKPRNR